VATQEDRVLEVLNCPWHGPFLRYGEGQSDCNT